MKLLSLTSSPLETTGSTLQDLLKGKSILLTGVTGFLAKVFLEKLLRICPDVKAVYLFIRAESGAHSLERAECEVFSSELFDFMKENFGQDFGDFVREKIQFVRGDTSLNRLGLNDKDFLKLTSEIDYVVNSAASTDFMNRLDSAIVTNTVSIMNLVNFVGGSKQARLLHISTCYVNEKNVGDVNEDFYEQPAGAPRRLPYRTDGRVDLPKVLGEIDKIVTEKRKQYKDQPEKLAAALIETGWNYSRARGWNNVYTFTKWLGENVLRDAAGTIHASILRPSIVESCLSEPSPGWIEGWKVGDPLIYAIGTQKINFFPSRPETIVDFIPVDIVSNGMFVALSGLIRAEKPELKVFHVCSGEENPLLVKKISALILRGFGIEKAGREPYIMPPVMWRMLEQTAKISGAGKFWFKQWSKFATLANIYSPYTSMQCRYLNSSLRALHAELSYQDRHLFPVSAAGFTWDDYLGNIHIPGLKRHVLGRSVS